MRVELYRSERERGGIQRIAVDGDEEREGEGDLRRE